MRTVKPLEEDLPRGKYAMQVLAGIAHVLPKVPGRSYVSFPPSLGKHASPTMHERTGQSPPIPNQQSVLPWGVETFRDTKGHMATFWLQVVETMN